MLMIVNFFSPDGRYDDIYLSNFATIYVKDELLRVYGVSDINYMGQRDYSIRAWLDPQKLASRSMTAMDVASAIRSENTGCSLRARSVSRRRPGASRSSCRSTRWAGSATRSSSDRSSSRPAKAPRKSRRPASSACATWPASSWALRTTTSLAHSTATRRWASPSTSSPEPTRSTSRTGCEPRWRSSRPAFRTGWTTTSPTTRRRTSASRSARSSRLLRDAVILVGLVVLVFLQDWRAMILPMIDVPVSLIGTFAVMAALGFSLNNLTLFGLVLAIGIVVDDAIVVLENIERMIAKGFDARTATIKAMEEITGPILAITLALCSVFVPCCFLGGITGQFFRQFAVTIAVSTIISAVNALTMTPSRAVLIFKTEEGSHGHELKREALPWWIFGVLGGMLACLVRASLPGRAVWPACPLGRRGESRSGRLDVLGDHRALYFAPRRGGRRSDRLVVIRPVNAVLGWLFRGFNRLFDVVTARVQLDGRQAAAPQPASCSSSTAVWWC